MLTWNLVIVPPSSAQTCMPSCDILLRTECEQRTSYFRTMRVGKISGTGIMPSDDRIRGPVEARAEHVRAGISTLQHDFACYRFQPFPRVLPDSADCRGLGHQPHRRAHGPVRFDFGPNQLLAAG